jgi:hypothetical protein
MTRRFITKQDVDACVAQGTVVIEIDDQVTVTDVARERARECGVSIVHPGSEATQGTNATQPILSLASNVRASVLAELGSAPDGLDEVIHRVLRDLTAD